MVRLHGVRFPRRRATQVPSLSLCRSWSGTVDFAGTWVTLRLYEPLLRGLTRVSGDFWWWNGPDADDLRDAASFLERIHRDSES